MLFIMQYVNSSAGAIAGIFINERYARNDMPKLEGWWGHKTETRFRMDNGQLNCTLPNLLYNIMYVRIADRTKIV